MQNLLFLILFLLSARASGANNAEITKRKIRSHEEENYESSGEYESSPEATETSTKKTTIPPTPTPTTSTTIPRTMMFILDNTPPHLNPDYNPESIDDEETIDEPVPDEPENHDFIMDNTPPHLAPTTSITTTLQQTSTRNNTTSVTNLNAAASNVNAGAPEINAGASEINAGPPAVSSTSVSVSAASQRELTTILKSSMSKAIFTRTVSLETFCSHRSSFKLH